MRDFAVLSLVGLLLLGCGGSSPPPDAPVPEPPATESAEAASRPPKSEPAQVAAQPPPTEQPSSLRDIGRDGKEKPTAVEPTFQEGGSVEDAIKAVPQGTERSNIDNETLGKPLQEFSVYEPCKPGTARFKLRVAVWDGRVVGSDVTTTPKNDKLAACIKDRLKSLTWQAKVRSLNVVEYAF